VSSGESTPPRRFLSQNFLVDANIQRKIVAALPLEGITRIVEVGPGRGALTEHLLELGLPLTVVEKDRRLAERWRTRAQTVAHLKLVEGDATEVALAELGDPASIAVIGNLPYHITTPLVFHLLQRPRPAHLVIMVQREVADRMVAPAGTSGYGALSVGVQIVADAEVLFGVPSTVFRPRPRVESAVVRLTPHAPPRVEGDDELACRVVVRAAFGWRRKQLAKILRDHPDLALGADGAYAVLEELGLEASARPETLDPPDFVRLGRAIRSRAPLPR